MHGIGRLAASPSCVADAPMAVLSAKNGAQCNRPGHIDRRGYCVPSRMPVGNERLTTSGAQAPACRAHAQNRRRTFGFSACGMRAPPLRAAPSTPVPTGGRRVMAPPAVRRSAGRLRPVARSASMACYCRMRRPTAALPVPPALHTGGTKRRAARSRPDIRRSEHP